MNFKNIIYFFSGIIILSFGLSVMSISEFGIGVSDLVSIRLAEITSIPITVFVLFFSILMLVIASLIEKKRIRLTCLITSFFLGFGLDFWIAILPKVSLNFYSQIGLYLVGVIILCFGIGIYLQPRNFAPVALDYLILVMKDNLKLTILKCKLIIDTCFFIIALLIGAPIGIGCFVSPLVIGPLIDIFYNIFML